MRKLLKIVFWTLHILVILFLGLSLHFHGDYLQDMRWRLDETELRVHENAAKAAAFEKTAIETTCRMDQLKSELEACKGKK